MRATIDRDREQRIYTSCLAASERIGWKVDDLIGGEKRLDFTKPFLPEPLVRAGALEFLSPREKVVLAQIRGYVYLRMFVTVEAFVLPFVLDHTRQRLTASDVELRALLQFASEEAKHTQLLNRFREEFERGFGTPCDFIGPQEDVVAEVASHHPLAYALLILMGEWASLAHYVEAVKDDGGIDPLFKSLLHAHWAEESQHARMDSLITEGMGARMPRSEIEKGLDELLEIGDFFDAGLKDQVEKDLTSLQLAIGRELDAGQRERFRASQLGALRWTFLGSGMEGKAFHETLNRLHPHASDRFREVAKSFR